jgi:hypothetical protein
MTLADDRNLVAAFVAGKPRYRRAADPVIVARPG